MGTTQPAMVSIGADAFLAGRTGFTRGAVMFEDSLVESAALLRTRNRWPALLSLTTQCAVAVLIVSLPLLHPELIPLPSRISVSVAAPHVQPPVELPRTRSVSATASASLPPVAASERGAACACHPLRPSGPPVDAPTLGNINLASIATGLPLGIGDAAPAAPRVSVRGSVGGEKLGPTRVSSGVIAGLLIAPIRPAYPEIARITRTEGTVVVDAVISRTGTIESAHVLSGPPMLRAAALAAVQQARYRPFMLNGLPTEVRTTVTIVFRMAS
jgi:protein TonB